MYCSACATHHRYLAFDETARRARAKQVHESRDEDMSYQCKWSIAEEKRQKDAQVQYKKHCEVQEYWFKCAWCDVKIAAEDADASERDLWKRNKGVPICESCEETGVTSRDPYKYPCIHCKSWNARPEYN